MKRAIEFYSEGFKLQGDVYTPDDLAPVSGEPLSCCATDTPASKDLYLPDTQGANEAGYVA